MQTVSTADQNLGLQRDALIAAGISPDRMYEGHMLRPGG